VTDFFSPIPYISLKFVGNAEGYDASQPFAPPDIQRYAQPTNPNASAGL
jgi:hypothetical protein